MAVNIPSHLVSAENEASAYIKLAEHEAFARGFLQVTQLVSPAIPEGSLLEVAQQFAEDDTERFKHVDGMMEIFETDDYLLGVALGVWAVRQKRKLEERG